MPMTPYPKQLAGNGTHGGYTPFHLFAGEKEIVTNQFGVPASTAFAQFEVAALTAAGVLAKFNPAASDGTQIARVVIAQPIASSATPPALAPAYVSAFFNHEALVWPDTVTTLAARKAAMVNTEIEVGALLGSETY